MLKLAVFANSSSVFILSTIGVLGLVLLNPGASGAHAKSGDKITGQIYLIGRDALGASAVQTVSAETFRENLSHTFATVQDSLVPELETHAALPDKNVLELRTVAVGIGLTGQIGLGPIFHISLTPKIRLVFSNSKSPVYPD